MSDSLIARLRELQPDRNLAFSAVDVLKTGTERVQFWDEYVNWNREGATDEHTAQHPEEVAAKNLGYVLSHYKNTTLAHEWQEVVPVPIMDPYGGCPVVDLLDHK